MLLRQLTPTECYSDNQIIMGFLYRAIFSWHRAKKNRHRVSQCLFCIACFTGLSCLVINYDLFCHSHITTLNMDKIHAIF